MKSVLLTPSAPLTIPRFYGRPNAKRLWEWAYKLDLAKYNILVTDPIDVTNFISKHMIYQVDSETYGMPEYWLQSAQEVYEHIFDKRFDDCDGAAIAVLSILYTLGNQNIRLALGYCGPDAYERSKTFGTNHAYCLLMRPDKPDNPYILDATGDNVIFGFDKVNNRPDYATLISASPFTQEAWAHGFWAEQVS